MKIIPALIDSVRSNAYEVQAGDSAGSIAEALSGQAGNYPGLIGANLHKTLIEVDGLPFEVFSSLEPGETLNVPASWSPGDMGYQPTSQQTALSNVMESFLSKGEAVGFWSIPVGQITPIAQTISAWWPYLKSPPNSTNVPAIDLAALLAWVGIGGNAIPNPGAFKSIEELIAAAKRYVDAVGAIPYLPWDRVPWDNWITHFPAFLQALGNDPQAVLELLKFMQTIATIPAGTPWTSGQSNRRTSGSQYMQHVTSMKSYAAPKFSAIDWTKPGYTDLIDWITNGYVDPSKIPWDLLMETQTTDCILKNPGRLAQMQADPCWQNPGNCDPLVQFKAMACNATYIEGWCNQPPCSLPGIPPGGGCKAKTCAQLTTECGQVDDGCGGKIDCGSCPDGKHCENGKCVEGQGPSGEADTSSSGWKWALGIVGLLAVAAGGYVAIKGMPGSKKNPTGCAQRNPLQSRVTKWHRAEFPEGIEIIDSMARTAWASHWASEQEEKGRSFSGQEIMGQAPKTPAAAKEWAVGAATKLNCANGLGWMDDPYWTMQHLFNLAVQAGGKNDPEAFGHYIAMQMNGHGVSWTDSNPDFDLKVPYYTFNG